MACTINPLENISPTPSSLPGCRGESVTIPLYKGAPPSQPLDSSRISLQDPEIQNFLKQENTTLGFKATNADIFLLMLELMKLEIESQQQEKQERYDERRHQLKYLEKEVDNYQSQAKWMLFSNLGAGLLGIAGGLAPIIGHTHGDGILGALSSAFTRFQGIKKRDFFENMAKILETTKQTQQAMGEIYRTKAEGDRTRWSRYGDNHRTDHELKSEKIRSLGERFRSCEQFLAELMRMQHDVAMAR